MEEPLDISTFPAVEQMDGFTVAGLHAHYPCLDHTAIARQWERFHSYFAHPLQKAAFGVCCGITGQAISYLSGFKSSARNSVPVGFVTMNIPAGNYEIFARAQHISELPELWAEIRNTRCLMQGPSFEFYDETFDRRTGEGSIEIWLPVKTGHWTCEES